MNIFAEKLPTSFVIDNEEYPVNTDFRIWIKIEKILMSNESSAEKAVQVITLCMNTTESKKLPRSLQALMNAIVDFYTCNYGKTSSSSKLKNNQKICDFDYDSGYIYSAFLAQYGIDLSQAEMHWWKFLALFKSLTEEHKISTIMGYRGAELSSIKDKKQKEFYKKMKRYYALPDTRTQEQKHNDFANVLSGII